MYVTMYVIYSRVHSIALVGYWTLNTYYYYIYVSYVKHYIHAHRNIACTVSLYHSVNVSVIHNKYTF